MITDIVAIGGEIINKIIPDPAAREAAKLELLKAKEGGQLKALEISMSAIVMEAKSSDPWTSRARPSFMYVFYAIIIMMTVVAPFFSLFVPDYIDRFYEGAAKGFAAVPEQLWTTFTIGYLGYAGARTYEKHGMMKHLQPKG